MNTLTDERLQEIATSTDDIPSLGEAVNMAQELVFLRPLLDERFRQWDIVANRHGPTSTAGCPLRSGCEAYDEAVVVSVSPFILTSRAGDMRWDCLKPHERAHLRVLRAGTIGEVSRAYERMRRDQQR